MKGGTWFSFFLVFTLAAIYRIEVGGFTPLQLILAGTIMELATFLFEIPTGVVADVHGRRRSMVLGYGIMGVAFMVEGWWPAVAVILLAQAIFGLGYTLISGAEDAWLADEIGEAAFGKAVLRGAQAEQLGSFLGIGASVAVASLGLHWPFWVAGAWLWLQALLVWRLLPETGFQPRGADPKEEEKPEGAEPSSAWHEFWGTFRQGLTVTRRRPLLWTLMAVALCYGLSSEGLDRLWEAHLLTHFTFPDLGGLPYLVWFGLIQACVLLVTLLATEWLRRRLDASADAGSAGGGGLAAHHLVLWLTLQSVLVVAGLVVFALSGSFVWAVTAFIIVNALRRVARPLFVACINRGLESSSRATVLSTVNQMDAFGQMAGGPAVGAVGNVWGLRAALLAVAALLVPVWGLYRRAWHQAKVEEKV